MTVTLMVEVQILTDKGRPPPQQRLTEWARAAWQNPSRDGEVVLRITDEAESRQLNHDYRGKDSPTNVLSFPFDPPPEVDQDHVGDLVVCAPLVAREAREQGKSADAHWAHMIVHGMLHLQGHDHTTDQQAIAMEALETDILGGLGFPPPYADDEKT
ncbi:MAG: rRNA maturation RNase YbeY [Sedimenticolaceae bacterium]